MKSFDHSSTAEITGGHKIVSYTVNTRGEYEQVADFICQPVKVANTLAWDEIDRQIAESREKVLAGRVSPLHYHMTANLMDTRLLAGYTGQPHWKVRLHLIPFIFNRLPDETLHIYAELFKITPEELTRGTVLSLPSLNYPS